MSALYTGGMVLNDAFDRDVDARERPERPLPSGAVTPSAAFFIGGGLLAAGALLLATFGVESAIMGAALAGLILIYDVWHKGNRLSPILMGACRALVYLGTAAAAGAALEAPVLGAALALLAYIAGVTQAAKGGAFQSPATSWPALLLACPVGVAVMTGDATFALLLLATLAAGAVGWAIVWLTSGVPRDREAAVGLLIAGIALMDAVVAGAHGSLGIALTCVALFALTFVLQRTVAGT
jgi:4-hydroxybenzoate polyprenyltransferase